MIQIVETADIERIQQLAAKCYLDAYKEIHTEEQNRFSYNEMYSTASLLHQLKEQRSRYFVLEKDGTDQAYAAICPLSDGLWLLDKLYVLTQSKGLGYGRTLVNHVIRKIKESETEPFTIVLKVNRRNSAVAFYQHLGFEITRSWDHLIADGKWVMDGYDMELIVK